MIGSIDRIPAKGIATSYRRRLEDILLVVRWIAVPLSLAMMPLLPKAPAISVGLIAGGLVAGNFAILVCLRRASRPRCLSVITVLATTLEWLAALGMVFISGVQPINPVPAVLILRILIDGLRFGLIGVAGATLAAESGSGFAIIRQMIVLQVLTTDLGIMVLARWAVIFLAAGLVIGLLLWKGQDWLRQEARRWARERAALHRRLEDAEQRSKDEETALRILQAGVSPRERQVLSLLADGLTYRQIAGHLSIDLETVRTHVRHLAVKLSAEQRGRKAVVVAAKEHGLLPPCPWG